MIDIDAAEARARRQLDGMTINRDAMARDVIALCALVRNYRTLNAKKEDTPLKDTSMAGTFEDIFKGFRK